MRVCECMESYFCQSNVTRNLSRGMGSKVSRSKPNWERACVGTSLAFNSGLIDNSTTCKTSPKQEGVGWGLLEMLGEREGAKRTTRGKVEEGRKGRVAVC